MRIVGLKSLAFLTAFFPTMRVPQIIAVCADAERDAEEEAEEDSNDIKREA